MNDLLTQIDNEFTACLNLILPEPIPKDAGMEVELPATLQHVGSRLSNHTTRLSNLIKDLELALSTVRLQELRKEEVSLQEEINLLHHDISLKSSTIIRYTSQLGRWDEELKALEEQSAKIVRRGDGTKRNRKVAEDAEKQDIEMEEEDEDEGEADLFEEV